MKFVFIIPITKTIIAKLFIDWVSNSAEASITSYMRIYNREFKLILKSWLSVKPNVLKIICLKYLKKQKKKFPSSTKWFLLFFPRCSAPTDLYGKKNDKMKTLAGADQNTFMRSKISSDLSPVQMRGPYTHTIYSLVHILLYSLPMSPGTYWMCSPVPH